MSDQSGKPEKSAQSEKAITLNVQLALGNSTDQPMMANIALVLWVDLLGVQAGDTVHMTIAGPNGQQVFEQQQAIDRTPARRFIYGGQKKHGGPGHPGPTPDR